MFNYAVAPKNWGAEKDYDSWSRGHWNPDKWVLHWPGSAVLHSDPARALQGIESFHVKTRRWRGIAYNYAIDRRGTVYRLRGERQSGATAGDYEPDGIPENYEARAVLFLNTTTQIPTDEQWLAFLRMWGEDKRLVVGHKDVSLHGTGTSTSCPGDAISALIKNFMTKEVKKVFTDAEVSALKAMVKEMKDVNSNPVWVRYAIDLIRRERQNPLHRPEAVALEGKQLVLNVKEVK